MANTTHSKEQQLFDLVDSLANEENIGFSIHDCDTSHNEQKWRVHYINGYCFEIGYKVDENDIYDYSFISDLDGFKKLNIEAALNLIMINK